MTKVTNRGAYFYQERIGNKIRKTLIRKRKGSLYPTVKDFSEKFESLLNYLGENIVETKIIDNGKNIQLEQSFIEGEGIFTYIKKKQPKNFYEFIRKLENLYSETGLLPDLLDDRNVLVTASGEIKIVDVWPIFFKERVESGDLNEQSYKENLEKFEFLKMKAECNT